MKEELKQKRLKVKIEKILFLSGNNNDLLLFQKEVNKLNKIELLALIDYITYSGVYFKDTIIEVIAMINKALKKEYS